MLYQFSRRKKHDLRNSVNKNEIKHFSQFIVSVKKKQEAHGTTIVVSAKKRTLFICRCNTCNVFEFLPFTTICYKDTPTIYVKTPREVTQLETSSRKFVYFQTSYGEPETRSYLFFAFLRTVLFEQCDALVLPSVLLYRSI